MAKADFLKERAESFRTTADYHIGKKDYPLAAFDLEQAAQLYLKYYLFLKIKYYPPIHSLKMILSEIGKAYQKEDKIEKFKDKYIHLISELENAYITSRYLPTEFTKKQIEGMKKFLEKLIEFLGDL